MEWPQPWYVGLTREEKRAALDYMDTIEGISADEYVIGHIMRTRYDRVDRNTPAQQEELMRAFRKIALDMQSQVFSGTREPIHVQKLNLAQLYKQYENDPVASHLIRHLEFLYEERDWMNNQVAATQRLQEKLEGYEREMRDMLMTNAMPKAMKWYDDPLKWAQGVKAMQDNKTEAPQWRIDEDTKQRLREGDIRDTGDSGPGERHQGRSGSRVSSLLRRDRG